MSDKIYAVIPTMPSRYNVLPAAVASLLPQVDEVIVYGNNCIRSSMPFGDGVTAVVDHENRGSVSRFMAGDRKGYLAFCDDDLQYPHDYIKQLIERAEHYQRKYIVGWHGKILNAPLISICGIGQGRIRENYPCLETVVFDTEVHMIGTGAMLYHSDTLQITEKDFDYDNLDDAEFSILCQKRGTPLVVTAHQKGELKYLHPEGTTIWQQTEKNQQPLLDLINSHEWKLFGKAP